jgi:YidC/Oxa1 family membrane protein insertase
MDRKAYIVLLISFVLLMLWYPVVNHFFPPTPVKQSTNTVTRATTSIPGTTNSAPIIAPLTNAPSDLSVQPRTVPQPNGPEETITIENEDARYTFSSHGGGLKSVELKKFPATVVCGREKAQATNKLATLNAPAPVPVMTILGLEGDNSFTLTKTASGVRAEKVLTNGLHLVKEFQTSTNYLLKTSVRFENRSSQPITLPAQEWVVGAATPIGQRDESLMLGVQWHSGSKDESVGEPYFANRTLGCFPGSPRQEYVGGASNVFWAAVHNQFFALIAVPSEPAPGVVARRISLPPPTKEEIAADRQIVAQPFGYQAALIYPGVTLPPNQAIERRLDLYAGPKEYNTLARLGNHLDAVMQFGFFGFFAKLLLLSMNALAALLKAPYGLVIIVITVLIKLLFWPLTNAARNP